MQDFVNQTRKHANDCDLTHGISQKYPVTLIRIDKQYGSNMRYCGWECTSAKVWRNCCSCRDSQVITLKKNKQTFCKTFLQTLKQRFYKAVCVIGCVQKWKNCKCTAQDSNCASWAKMIGRRECFLNCSVTL